jgi:hypothetical protein
MCVPARWTSSVSIPSAFNRLNAAWSRAAVLPSFRVLPLNATTFIDASLYVGFDVFLMQKLLC